MTRRHLSRRKIHLSDLVGHVIGSTICFEIIDGYFYGLSNQTSFEVEEIDWTSYYYCFRFRLDESNPDKTQIMKKRDSWRRQHAEGPIDDRWGFLKLEQDETTGKLRIIESRKEWLTRQSRNRRSYYTTNVVFKDEGEGTADEESEDNTENNLPDDPLTVLLEPSSNPNYMPPPERLPCSIHAGDNGTIYNLSKTHLRSYFYSSETFLDLIDDSIKAAYLQRLPIRAGKKMAARSMELPATSTGSGIQNFKEKEKLMEFHNRITMWPEYPEDCCSDLTLEKLSRITNPKDHQGGVSATNGKRSIVYTTGGGTGSLRVLVWISFDPAAKLSDAWRGEGLSTSPEAHDGVGCARGYAGEQGNASFHDKAGGGAIKWGFAGVSDTNPQHAKPLSKTSPAKGAGDWARVEKAMYTHLSRQYVQEYMKGGYRIQGT